MSDLNVIIPWIIALFFHYVSGQWTIKGSSSVAVVGIDFALSCTVPQNTDVPQVIQWVTARNSEFIETSRCQVANNIWPTYTYTCNNRVFTVTIPGTDISKLNGATWNCGDAGGSKSNTITITVLDPVQQITMNGTNPLVVHVANTVTIMCTTSPSRPAAHVVWYKDTDNITSDATAVVEKQAEDKYVTRSYLSLTGNKGDSGKTIKCEGYNGAPDRVSDSTTLEILYPPPNIQTLAGYTSNAVLYVGNVVTLTCQQEGGRPFSSLSLSCNGKTGVAEGSSTGSLVELKLTIDSSYNGKMCSCVSTHVVNNYRKVVSVVLSVHYPPSQPSISVTPTFPWLEKTRGSLQCNVANKGNPSLTIYTWLDSNSVLAGESGENLTFDSLSNLDHGRQISCRVTNSASTAPISKVISLNVEYSPIITLNKDNFTVIEGEKVDRICTAEGNPEPNVKWLKGSTVVGGGSGTSATLTIPDISRTATGVYTCLAKAVSAVAGRNKLFSSQDSNLIVQYPPDVHIQLSNVTEYSINVQLICIASGVPPVYKYIGWKQMIGESTARTQFPGLSDDRRVLTFDNVTFADAGLYSCEVSNNIKYPQTATNYFDVKASAKFKPDAKTYTFYSEIEQELVVTIPFYSNPPATVSNIKWFNHSDNSVIGKNENITFDLVYSSFDIPLHSVAVSLNGQIARMNISSFQSYQHGNYSITVSNGLGTTSSVKFFIILRSRPDPPFGIRAVCKCSNTAEIIWISKFNGGSIQYFNVKMDENAEVKIRENISDPGKDEIVSVIIDNLHSRTQYFFTVYAENNSGQSSLSKSMNCTTPEKDTKVPGYETGSSTASTASIVLFVLSSIFIVCGTMALVVKFIVERRKNKLHQRVKTNDKALDLTNTYQELGEREQPVDQPYQKIDPSDTTESIKDGRNIYQEVSDCEQLDYQYQNTKSDTGKQTGSDKGNVYEDLAAHRDRPNIYDKVKC